MGCLLCSITRCKEFAQGPKPAINNPFYCKTRKAEREFISELAGDIATRHSDMMRKINKFYRAEKKRTRE